MDAVAPSRMHLQLRKQQQATAMRGKELLENKREALVKELIATAGQTMEARGALRKKMQNAKNTLGLGLGVVGRPALFSVGLATRRDLEIERVEKNIWGVRFYDFRFQTAVRALDARGYSMVGTHPVVDETARTFEEVLDHVFRTLSIEMKLKRIGREIRKLNRRVNALNEQVIPMITAQIKDIEDRLEERELESFFRLKRFKKRNPSR